MRYYKIVITDPTSSSSTPLLMYTSHPNGVNSPPDPGALKVELDLFEIAQATATTNSHVKIWGIPLDQISQAHNLNPITAPGSANNPKNIVVYGGMGKGLPLAKPGQSGKLVEGIIIQAFGNWVGVNMTLDLLIAPGTAPKATPDLPNLTFNYKGGQQLSPAIKNALKIAYPTLTVNVNIASNLVLNYDQPGYYGALTVFATYIKGLSKQINPDPKYQGVDIVVKPGGIIDVFDGTSPPSGKTISFEDLLGQPTWIAPYQIQVPCVMRADIHMDDIITLPKSLLTTRAASASGLSGLRQGPVFSGSAKVLGVIRHVGDYKSPDSEAWATYLTCIPVEATTAASTQAPTTPVSQAPSPTVQAPATATTAQTATPPAPLPPPKPLPSPSPVFSPFTGAVE